MPSFLHIGCGLLTKEDTTLGFQKSNWNEVRYDIDENVKPDVVGSMVDMKGIESSSFDAIFSSHNIEHLYAHEVILAMSEFYRVLKSDGFIILTCPDLQSVCSLIAQDKLTEPAYNSPAGPIAPFDILYGHRKSISNGNLYMAHHSGFTKKVLAATLATVGFQTVAVRNRPRDFDLWAAGLKITNETARIHELSGEHFPAE